MQKPDFQFVKDGIDDAWIFYPAEDQAYLLEAENYGITIRKHDISQSCGNPFIGVPGMGQRTSHKARIDMND